MKKHKNLIIVMILLSIGIILILFGGSIKSNNSSTDSNYKTEEYTEQLEKKVEDFLLTIEGISKAKVIITLDDYATRGSYNDRIYIYPNSSTTQNNIIGASPPVRGIAIACTNGDNDEVKIKVTRLVSAYLGISANRIEIAGIK